MSNQNTFDIIVVGAGPGGYVAAIRAAQLGFKTALIEKDKYLGGTCLNVGCIPSKALLHSSELFTHVKHHSKKQGIVIQGDVQSDIPTVMKHKEDVVQKLRQGVETLVSKRGITIFQGVGRFQSANKIEVISSLETTVIEGKHIIIATGSSSVELPFMKFDGNKVISSDHGIALKEVPKKMVVIGAGAIGLELGSVWGRYGAEVTVIEMLPNVAPTFDKDISKLAEKIFKKQGMHFELEAKVTGLIEKSGKTYVTVEKAGKKLEFEADKVLVAVGRRPHTEGLGLEKIGLALDERKRIPVDNHYRTSVPGVYAIGDVTPGPMLAHKAEEEGVAVVELIAGKGGHVNYEVIPNVVYTDPEISSVGLSEDEAVAKGLAVNTGKFNFAGNGRAIASDAIEGMVKVIACQKTDKILGVQIIGKNSSELIDAAVTHMEYGGSAEDLARTVHAHPTLSEAMKEAALAVEKRAIHAL